jgi:hypothetical protein
LGVNMKDAVTAKEHKNRERIWEKLKD